MSSIEAGVGGWVITPNVDILRRIVSDPAFARLAASADLSIADGMPLVWASRLQGTSLPGSCRRLRAGVPTGQGSRSAGVQPLPPRWCARAPPRRRRSRSSTTCRRRPLWVPTHPRWASSTTTRSCCESSGCCATATPDIVLCAFGCPKQERLDGRAATVAAGHMVHRRGRVLHDCVRTHPGGPAVDAAFGTRVAPPSAAGAPTPVPPLHRQRPPLRTTPAGHERARRPPLAAQPPAVPDATAGHRRPAQSGSARGPGCTFVWSPGTTTRPSGAKGGTPASCAPR